MRRDAGKQVSLSPAFWVQADTVAALRTRNVGRLLRLVGVHAGASQTGIGLATGLSQGQVSQVMNGTRQLSTLDVLERLADGLAMPDDARMLLGLAPRQAGPAEPEPTTGYPLGITAAVSGLERLSIANGDGHPLALNAPFRPTGFVVASRDWMISRAVPTKRSEVRGSVTSADATAIRDTFAAFQELDTKRVIQLVA